MFSKKTILLFVAILVFANNTEAQKKQFTMAEAVNGMTTTLALQSVKQASWQPGTHRFCQVVNDYWIATDYPKGNTDTLFSLSQFNKSIPWLLKAEPKFLGSINLNSISTTATFFIEEVIIVMEEILQPTGLLYPRMLKILRQAQLAKLHTLLIIIFGW
jgi:hypothetical protein